MDHDCKKDEAGDDLGNDVLKKEEGPIQNVVVKFDADGPDEADKAGKAGDGGGSEDAISSIGMLISGQAGPLPDGLEHLDPDDEVKQAKEEGEASMQVDGGVSAVVGQRIVQDPVQVDDVIMCVFILAAVGAVVDGHVGFLRGTYNKDDVEDDLAGDVDGGESDKEPPGKLFDPIGEV